MNKNKIQVQAMAAGLFTSDALSGSPLMLILAIACIGYGVWRLIKDKNKPKSQRDQEARRSSQQFIDNINRNEGLIKDIDEPAVVKKNRAAQSAEKVENQKITAKRPKAPCAKTRRFLSMR